MYGLWRCSFAARLKECRTTGNAQQDQQPHGLRKIYVNSLVHLPELSIAFNCLFRENERLPGPERGAVDSERTRWDAHGHRDSPSHWHWQGTGPKLPVPTRFVIVGVSITEEVNDPFFRKHADPEAPSRERGVRFGTCLHSYEVRDSSSNLVKMWKAGRWNCAMCMIRCLMHHVLAQGHCPWQVSAQSLVRLYSDCKILWCVHARTL